MAKGKISDLFFEIGYKVNPDGMKKAESAFDKIGQKTEVINDKIGKATQKTNAFGTSLSSLGKYVGGAYVVTTALKYVYTAAKNGLAEIEKLDNSLRTVISKVDANENSLRELMPVTRQVAREYHVMADSVAEAQNYLALAGYSLEEIKAGTSSVVAAQRATGDSMKAVSDIATDTASAYGYTADELDYVTDRMVYTTTKFNTDFVQMGEAMKYVAPIAKQAGMEFDDLNAYIGILANSGIKGSQAGTALRMAFLRLQAPTKEAERQLRKFDVKLYDNKGNFVGINQAMINVEKAMKGVTDKEKAMFMQQVFGTETLSAMNILFKEGTESIMAWGDSVGTATGKTQEMAEFMEQGFGGLQNSVKSEWQNLSTEFGLMLEPAATPFLEALRDGMKNIADRMAENRLKKEEEKEKDKYLGYRYGMYNTNAFKGYEYVEKNNPKKELHGADKLIYQTGNILTAGMMGRAYDEYYINEAIKKENLEREEAIRIMNEQAKLFGPTNQKAALQNEDITKYSTPKIFTTDKKIVDLNLNVTVNGVEDLGSNLGKTVQTYTDKKVQEQFLKELYQTNFNLGGGYY